MKQDGLANGTLGQAPTDGFDTPSAEAGSVNVAYCGTLENGFNGHLPGSTLVVAYRDVMPEGDAPRPTAPMHVGSRSVQGSGDAQRAVAVRMGILVTLITLPFALVIIAAPWAGPMEKGWATFISTILAGAWLPKPRFPLFLFFGRWAGRGQERAAAA